MTQETDTLSSALEVPQKRIQISALTALLCVAILGCVGTIAYQQYALNQWRQESTRLIAENQRQTLVLQNQSEEQKKALAGLAVQLGAQQNQQATLQSREDALNSIYDTLTRGQTLQNLAEIEQMLTFTSQQLQLTGNAADALATLNSIDQQLQALNRPELITLRKAIARDIAALQATPKLDTVGLMNKIDTMIGNVDKLPLEIDAARDPQQTPPPAPANASPLARLAHEFWSEFRQLVQIRRMDKPDAMLFTPQQSFFLKENIKLRLLNARTALLMRNENAYRSDISATQHYLQQYFNQHDAAVAQLQGNLGQLASQQLSIALPDISASLAAVREARLVSERSKS